MSKLKNLSDEDLDRLYNDAKAGIRSGNYKVENDGDDVSGYQQADFYTGQTMSSDYNRNEKGKDEEELMELSDLYADNVYTDYRGGRLSDQDIRNGFTDIFNEKERRRDEKYLNQETTAEAVSPEQKEPFQKLQKSEDHNKADAAASNSLKNNDAADNYRSAFDRAVNAGREMSASDFLQQRAADKKSGLSRFTHFLRDSNTLAAHESSHAGQNAIKRADYEELNPPELIDPGDLYDRYKGDIDDI